MKIITIQYKPPACNSLHFVSFKHAVPYPKTGVPPDYGVYGTVPCPSHENGYENKNDFFETQNEKIYEMKHGMTNGNHQNGIVQYKNLMTRNALVQTVGRVQSDTGTKVDGPEVCDLELNWTVICIEFNLLRQCGGSWMKMDGLKVLPADSSKV